MNPSQTLRLMQARINQAQERLDGFAKRVQVPGAACHAFAHSEDAIRAAATVLVWTEARNTLQDSLDVELDGGEQFADGVAKVLRVVSARLHHHARYPERSSSQLANFVADERASVAAELVEFLRDELAQEKS